MKRLLLFTILLWLAVPSWVNADETPNAKQARRIFNQTYDMVFGPQGSTLQYHVNIIGVMKVSGKIWYKGKKKRFEESRYLSWSDGVNDSWVDLKKKTVTLYDIAHPRKTKYSGNFTFNPNEFDYYVEDGGSDFIITLNAHKHAKSNIKHAKAIIDKKTRAPKSLKVKVMLFWATINISNFHSGITDDSIFNFPRKQFGSYKFIDKRNE